MPLPDFLGEPTELAAGTHAGIAAVGNMGGQPNPLPLQMQSQLQTEWCWAAVTASVCAFYRDQRPKKQCELATDLLFADCCIDPLPPPPPPGWEGNMPYALEEALTYVKHLNGSLIDDVISFEAIMAEINAGNPVCCHIQWTNSGALNGHFNAIVGYNGQTQDVIVRDPFSPYGESTLPYETFKSNYHGGTWDQTYRTR